MSSSDSEYFAPIHIYINRDSTNEEDNYDAIYIRPDADTTNKLVVRYLDKESDKNYTFTDTWENVQEYLDQIFTVLPLDSRPFYSVQFVLPAYPSIEVRVDDMPTSIVLMDTIMSMIQSVVEGWPVSKK